jgi:error-prone DNA polymerase
VAAGVGRCAPTQPRRDGRRFSRRWPGVVESAGRLGAELAFDLELIAPQLPPFPVPAGHGDEMAYLRELTYIGALRRYGPRGSATERAYGVLEHELGIIEQLGFPGYFLIVWELVEFCRREGIMCQGRGSAANSAVCYALGVTAVDAVRYGLLFERFLSPERDGPPDIDIDIESDRREEVIQHVYATHGREFAAQVANVITYRPPSAIRDVAKALGYSPGQQDAWSKQVERHYWTRAEGAALEGNDAGAGDNIPDLVLDLAGELQNTPRHLGIHSGGMVICDRPIIEVCPVEWARMANRSVLQWDKDDCANAGLTKFDLLGLGMLSALRYTFEFVEAWHGRKLELYDIPADDLLVYDMLCRADTVGVFQIESRAQMATLPRLKPRNFYDLAIEIALIRPGPIQGNSVHPYLRRRRRDEAITYPHPSLKPVLRKTLGVPVFQEQLMNIAVIGAGFSPGEADTLRRAMGSKRSVEKMESLRQRLYDGMAANGITGPPADDIYEKIKGFSSFGFPESHSISFAFLALASAWLKLYYPAALLAALLRAQPMGFYSPQSLVRDARQHGIEVRGVAVNASHADASLEPESSGTYSGPGPEQPAVRLGLSAVRTISADVATRIVDDRARRGPYTTMADLARRVGLSSSQLEALATAGALDELSLSRHEALWAAGSAAANRPGQLDVTPDQGSPPLPPMTQAEQLTADLWATGITRDSYPTALIRDQLDERGVTTAHQLASLEDRTRVWVAGIVTHRQRPPSARGVTFISLEDETGLVNIIVPQTVWSQNRRVARDAAALLIRGTLERGQGATNVLAERIERLPLITRTASRDFR